MTREEISVAVGGISDRYIEEAAEPVRSRLRPARLLKVALPLAACLALVISLGQSGQKGEAGTGEAVAPECAGTEDGEGMEALTLEVWGWEEGHILGRIPPEPRKDLDLPDLPVRVILPECGQAFPESTQISVRFSRWEQTEDELILYAEAILPIP